jgi:glutamate 5-kinase
MDREQIAESSEHWVVKIGSNVFLRDQRVLDRPAFTSLIADMNAVLGEARGLTVVSSGAVALGREHLDWPDSGAATREIPHLQALAALGQSRLIQMYADEFEYYGKKVAQVLLSRADLDDRGRYLNARMALGRLHELGAVPVINENDTVATDELRFGDNDTLAAMTCGVVGADLLILLSDVESIFDVEIDEDGTRRFTERIATIGADDPELDRVAGPSTTSIGTGGMLSKVQAARTAARMGVPTLIAPGKQSGILQAIAHGEDVGTLIEPSEERRLAGKKVWIGTGAMAIGTLDVDAGAARALKRQGASLLPSGIVEVHGPFSDGDIVEIRGPDGELVARGVCVYGSEEVEKIAGHHSDEIESILGYKVLDTVVHRDSLAVL